MIVVTIAGASDGAGFMICRLSCHFIFPAIVWTSLLCKVLFSWITTIDIIFSLVDNLRVQDEGRCFAH